MRNISDIEYCYGCGVCVCVCPVDIISLRLNKDGFYSPEIDNNSKCIDCGRCLKVCAYNHEEIASENNYITAYAAWSKDNKVRNICSSGGVSFEIGKYLIHRGYNALGVRFDCKNNRAEHYISETVEQFRESMGSKYIPSFTVKAFLGIDFKKKYYITGTPCQIDSVRRWLKLRGIENNFILLDFFCHGVPSLFLLDKYLESIKCTPGDKIETVRWRSKSFGWHDSWVMDIDVKAGTDADNKKVPITKYVSKHTDGDLFYKFFLENYCLNSCCYRACKYKMLSSSADIRIGDLWGKSFEKNEKGISAVIAMTERGRGVIKDLGNGCVLKEIPIDLCCEGQMVESPGRPVVYNLIIRCLRLSGLSLSQIKLGVIYIYKLFLIPAKMIKTIKFRYKYNQK